MWTQTCSRLSAAALFSPWCPWTFISSHSWPLDPGFISLRWKEIAGRKWITLPGGVPDCLLLQWWVSRALMAARLPGLVLQTKLVLDNQIWVVAPQVLYQDDFSARLCCYRSLKHSREEETRIFCDNCLHHHIYYVFHLNIYYSFTLLHSHATE